MQEALQGIGLSKAVCTVQREIYLRDDPDPKSG